MNEKDVELGKIVNDIENNNISYEKECELKKEIADVQEELNRMENGYIISKHRKGKKNTLMDKKKFKNKNKIKKKSKKINR